MGHTHCYSLLLTAAAAAGAAAVAAAAAGYNSLQDVMSHPCFAGIDWQAVRQAPACTAAATHCCRHSLLLLLLAAGYNSLQDVMSHPFFAGVDWQVVRQAPAPKFAPQPATDRQDLSLDWELTSLFRQAAAPAVKYEYLPTGATV
jgi:hypothetical protein